MARKTLLMTLIAVGLVAAATSAAFGIYPANWFSRQAAPATATAALPAAVTPLPSGAVPNYRAIVQQAGPAVVGVTVAGLHEGAP